MTDSSSQASSSNSSSSSVASSSTSTSTTSVSSTERPLREPKEDKYPITASSTSLPLTSSSTTQPSSQLPSTTLSSLKFFQTQKPAVIENETPRELKQCISKFQELFDDHSYTFIVKRTKENQLILQFTANKDVAEDDTEITEQLRAAATLLRQLVQSSGVAIKSNQFKLDWKTWALTMEATAAEIDGIAWLLQNAIGKYITRDNSASDGEATCRLQ